MATQRKPTTGHTRAAIEGERAPRLPHEHDESSDSASGPPQDVVRQAGVDVENGLVDTDRGPEADAVYRESLKKPSAAGHRGKR